MVSMGFNDAIVLDGFDEAAVGTTEDGRIVYDFDRMAEILCKRDEMSKEEAEEYLDYNVALTLPSWGDKKPIILYPLGEKGLETDNDGELKLPCYTLEKLVDELFP